MLLVHCRECCVEIVAIANPDRLDCNTKRPSGLFDLVRENSRKRIRGMSERCHAFGRRQYITDKLNRLCKDLLTSATHARNIAPGPRQAGNQTRSHRITDTDHHNGNFGGCLPCCSGGRCERCDNDIDLPTDEIVSQVVQACHVSICRAKFERNILSLNIAKLAESSAKFTQERLWSESKNADCKWLWLLRTRCDRACYCTAHKRNEFAPRHSQPQRLRARHRSGSNWLAGSGQNGAWRCRFGSKADIGAGPRDVRFTPKSGHDGVRLAFAR